MTLTDLEKTLGKVDIYLLDQLMKKRFAKSDLILDAGCGNGRNLFFLNNLGFNVQGCDFDNDTINTLSTHFSKNKLTVAALDNLPYKSQKFNHIICNAVLHFSENEVHFLNMINELHRVLKPNGTLFIRMTSVFGIEKLIKQKKGQYLLPDGTVRFLLTFKLIEDLKIKFDFLEPLKTVNVSNLRCMSTLLLVKNLSST